MLKAPWLRFGGKAECGWDTGRHRGAVEGRREGREGRRRASRGWVQGGELLIFNSKRHCTRFDSNLLENCEDDEKPLH
jgi:hypothetical protein